MNSTPRRFAAGSPPQRPTLTDADRRAILGVADHLIGRAGRTVLMMGLRGSKAQRVLQYGVATARGYGYYAGTPEPDVLARVDALIHEKLLRLAYHDGFPLLSYTAEGLALAERYAAEDWLALLRSRVQPVTDGATLELPFFLAVMPQRNLRTVELVVKRSGESADKSWLPLLRAWQKAETKRVRAWITPIIAALEKG